MIDQHYRAFCSCGVLICACDCPARTKMPIVIRDGCDYCAKQAALRRAIEALRAFPALRHILK